MVKYFLIIILLFSVSAEAQDVQFSAYLDRSKIAAGEKFQMKLELINADPYSAPDISLIPADITIISQSQESSAQIINGIMTKNSSWIYDMKSDKAGSYNFPSISIQTNKGQYKTNPFKIVISDTTTLPQDTETKTGKVLIKAEIDNKAPFQDEPVLYSLKIFYTTPVEEADISKPKSEKAIIEQLSDPVQTKEDVDGVMYDVISIDYSITPISSGKIKIEPAVLRGTILQEVKEERPRTAFDDFFDPFSVLENGSSVSQKNVPFTVASNQVQMDVKPPVSTVSPWLALYGLELESELTDITYNPSKPSEFNGKLGEPFNLKIKISAIGKSAEQLPDLEKYIISDDFKVYTDKPDLKTEKLSEVKSYAEGLRGIKTQIITLIPQKTGELKIPIIKIPYWNIKDNKEDFAYTTERTVVVAQNSDMMDIAKNITTDSKKKIYASSKVKDIVGLGSKKSTAIIGILLLIIIILYIKVSGLRKKLDESVEPVILSEDDRPKTKSHPKKIVDNIPSGSKPVSKPIIKNNLRSVITGANNLDELKKKIQQIAHAVSGVADNSSLPVIAQKLSRDFNIDKGKIVRSSLTLEEAVNQKNEKSFLDLRQVFSEIFDEIEEKIKFSSPDKNADYLQKLNP